ncbi:hypothetical protein predicted by Glimmer/Critica (plasmid) [Sinorhizobium fredii HH103]|uniref:Uncharacterized protein n=1 Tax=Sinorhizobium fredii (strain HH103) TaxID=1117943 RepID=G9AGA7_SINF1|nr:hypothetical protein predicted by Glimmer/Critica [Sinorhizobium fredii HH103]
MLQGHVRPLAQDAAAMKCPRYFHAFSPIRVMPNP